MTGKNKGGPARQTARSGLDCNTRQYSYLPRADPEAHQHIIAALLAKENNAAEPGKGGQRPGNVR